MIPGIDAHTYRRTSFGAEVFVLETGAAIGPEAEAMLQALHSRSTGGLRVHLRKLTEKGSEQFMTSHYVGYGHKSIGDCGTTTVFAEGISMLAAKAIQDWQLYSGQESSTRFLNFSRQPFLNPVGTETGHIIQENWRTFYLGLQEPVRAHLRAQFPRGEDEDPKLWEKAIAARAFDITRAFLPAGTTTNIAWHTNLRQAADKLALLRHHPLPEVVVLAEAMESALQERFPSSFSQKCHRSTEYYNAVWMVRENYHHDPMCPDFKLSKNTLCPQELSKVGLLLPSRPPKTELPPFMEELGQLQFQFTLDFGSFRDIQRHRAVIQRMPLLTRDLGFHPWYLEQLPAIQQKAAQQLLDVQRERTTALDLTREIEQYYLPMGYRISCRLTGGLSRLVYLVELRATRFVHPTLRMRAQQMADVLLCEFGPYGLVLHLDPDPGRFDVRRGSHDIIER